MEVADRPATPWAGAIERVVPAGEVLVHEGGDDDDVFTVVDGSFEILRGPELVRIDTVGPGGTIGEIAALAGCPRTATVRALEASLVRQLEGSAHQRWLASDERRWLAMVDVARSRIDRHRTIALVAELLSIDLDARRRGRRVERARPPACRRGPVRGGRRVGCRLPRGQRSAGGERATAR